jgi:hypothetical protein
MDFKRRLKTLEKQFLAEDNMRIVICRQLVKSLDDKAVLEKHFAEADIYIKAHPELWNTTDSGDDLKIIKVVVNGNGWNIEGHTQA